MKEFIEKSNQAAAAYLNRRGYEIVEQPWEDDIDSPVSIVAQDEDSLVSYPSQSAGTPIHSRRST